MHPLEIRERAIAMHAANVPFRQIWQTLGLPKHTVGNWLYGERARRHRERQLDERCPRCADPPRSPDAPAAYAYLLGQYLGDSHVVHARRTMLLAVYCDNKYPGIIAEIGAAMRECGARSVYHRAKIGCTAVSTHWNHWPCLLPQHGPGPKHARRIELTAWQQPIVDTHAEAFIRGLIHSDGCRFTNRVTVSGRTYEYPRYMFTNESVDIMNMCGRSLNRLGIDWRMSRRNTLSVAKRAAVARLDEFVGPKS
ncbi:transcriptional regulator [Catenuloplanes sp. NPDC051500]|uniref:transcriptional regulator n=1 Tax=Catenuloplanes sp. NPDC051500 TaxID=3363959 RepID=UPI0037BA0EB3